MQNTEPEKRYPQHDDCANAIRALSMDAVQNANSGHPGMPMGMADVATVLFGKFLKFNVEDPEWPDRDRFVLSAGHGSMLLYSILHLCGYRDFPVSQLKNFRQLGSTTAGHPECEAGAGIETTTGPLGQGLANAVGMAIAEEHLRAVFGRRLVSHATYVLAGDGCLMEGISHEAIGLAGHLRLSRLIVLWDDNRITIDGDLSLSDSTNQLTRFEAAGWSVFECDGHDPEQISRTIARSRRTRKPSMIAFRTKIGYGSPNKEGSAAAHGSPLGVDEIARARERLAWKHPPFEIPPAIRNRWQQFGERGREDYDRWVDAYKALPKATRARFDRLQSGTPPKSLRPRISSFKRRVMEERPTMATRKSSQMVLSEINPVMPELVGGSADLTGSNNTKTAKLNAFARQSRRGRYIYYGIREHGMAGAMNGMALHGGVRPYGGTFLCFADYARPSMRLSALMHLPVTYVMTHDSIGLGEDGPTHQPVEHLAMLRATPNLNVFRPCDTVETAECWYLAVTSTETPSVIALTRQGLPTLRLFGWRKNWSANGAYVLADFGGPRRVVLLASGSEVAVAMESRKRLAELGIGARVVSMPCWELFERQPEAYRKKVLPRGAVRVGIEAGARLGWDRWLSGERGAAKKSGFVGMNTFGASAPGAHLYDHFGITAEAVTATALELLG
ncbi:MAG: transketolase [Rhodobacteraceae bacterium]|nr:transketolase [Paracoccaceae bacterium]